ncbi:MAG: hypothetical protein Q7S36_00040 [Candidatus Liptonbacteria bacterium]|nr:hypothetical protein [Candidatus Liptonbacteria bacterium]
MLMKIFLLVFAFLGLPVLADESPPLMRNPSIPALVAEAKEFIAKETPEAIYKGSGKKRVLVGKESLRVTLSPSGALRVVRLNLIQAQKIIIVKTKKGFRKKTIQVFELASAFPPACIAEKLGGTGVNTNYRITCDGREEMVLAGRELITEGKPPWKTTLYVPYSDALATNETVSLGEMYLRDQISKAAENLRRKKVLSLAIPDKLVADIIPEAIPFLLALIEHIDHDEFKEHGAVYMMRKVLTQLGTNGPDTFIYARSRTGALCLMQIQPSTYRGIQATYRKAKLPKSAVVGSCVSHELAIEVAYLVLDSKLADMPASFQGKFLADPGSFGLYLAAAYNGGQKRASDLYLAEEGRQLGLLDVLKNLFAPLAQKKEKTGFNLILREETWIFIKKYFELSNISDANEE